MRINVIIVRGILSEYKTVCCLIFNDGCTRIRANTPESMQVPERQAQPPSEAPERSPDDDCGEAMTWTRATVWASAAISGPVLSGSVRSPTIYGALRWQEMVGTNEVRVGKHRCATSQNKLPTSFTNFEAV